MPLHGSARLLAGLRTLVTRLPKRVAWRWTQKGSKAIWALPFYLFPAWLRSWTWQGAVLGLLILVGNGNIKYFFLDLLFLFPVKEDEEVSSLVPFKNAANG